jgi:hypothetical protein
MSRQVVHGGVADNKLGKCGKLHVNGTTKVSRAQAPIFLIFVVPRGRYAEGLGMVRQSLYGWRMFSIPY